MIKRRNLDPSLISWIASFAGLGPGIGRVVHCVKSDSAYYSWLKDDMKVPTDELHHTVADAYNDLTASRNDVVLIYPGTYTIPAALTWAKAQTHMIGVGNPTWRQGGKTRIISTDTGITATVDITATGVFFGGFNISQNGAASGCVTPLRLSSTYFRAKQLDLRGNLSGSVAGVATSSSLEFAATPDSAGFAATFEDCNIGTSSGSARSGNSGVIYFAHAVVTGPGYIEFKNCRILGRSTHADAYMVLAVVPGSKDRYCLFDNCLFYNWVDEKAATLATAFYHGQSSGAAGQFVLKDCVAVGIDEWQLDDNDQVESSMPVGSTQGGLVRQPTAPVS